jgi:predicted TIM-barrel fold metal-dependent hydrolase
MEPILEPDLPIVDPHHHLWDRRALLARLPPPSHGFDQVLPRTPLYLLDQLNGDIGAGHNVCATVFVECGVYYRSTGEDAVKPVGETEFVNGVAAMSASGQYGSARACAAIVGHANLALGDAVAPVLEAHIGAGGGRFRGIRDRSAWDADPAVLGPLGGRAVEGALAGAAFRKGFSHLARLGLSFDAWVLEPQLPQVVDLARAFPETPIVLDHVGTPLGVGRYRGRREERFATWRENICALASCQNVAIKLGGLAMPFCGFPSLLASPAAHSEQLAQEWRPYIEACIEAFGPKRAMFESNFPVDAVTCPYATLWNAFKRITGAYSADDKHALYFGAAAAFYRLAL